MLVIVTETIYIINQSFTATEIMLSTSVIMISASVIHRYRENDINQSLIAEQIIISTSVIAIEIQRP